MQDLFDLTLQRASCCLAQALPEIAPFSDLWAVPLVGEQKRLEQVKKDIAEILKECQYFAFRNSPFTRQHN